MTDRFTEIRARVKSRYADGLGSLFRDDAQCIRDLETLLTYIDLGESAPVRQVYPLSDFFGGVVVGVLNTERGPVGSYTVKIAGVPLCLNPFMPPGVIRLHHAQGCEELDLRVLDSPQFRGMEIAG